MATSKICTFWNGTAGSCRNGDKCRYVHPVLGSALSRSVVQPSLRPTVLKAKDPCRYWKGTPESCRNGDKCAYVHDYVHVRPSPSSVVQSCIGLQGNYAAVLGVIGGTAKMDLAAGSSGAVSLQFNVVKETHKPTAAKPLYVAIALDVSGSMSGGKLEEAKQGIKEIVATLRDQERVALVWFNDTVGTAFDFTAKKDVTSDKIDCLCAAGRTALWDGALRTLDLFEATRTLGNDAQRYFFLLTDGDDNCSSAGAFQRLKSRLIAPGLGNFNVRIFAVGEEDVGLRSLQGKEHIKVTSLSDPGAVSVRRAFQESKREIESLRVSLEVRPSRIRVPSTEDASRPRRALETGRGMKKI